MLPARAKRWGEPPPLPLLSPEHPPGSEAGAPPQPVLFWGEEKKRRGERGSKGALQGDEREEEKRGEKVGRKREKRERERRLRYM